MPLNRDKLRELRGNTTQHAFAKLAKMPQSTIAEYESGRKRNPTSATLDRLARACSQTSGRTVAAGELLM